MLFHNNTANEYRCDDGEELLGVRGVEQRERAPGPVRLTSQGEPQKQPGERDAHASFFGFLDVVCTTNLAAH